MSEKQNMQSMISEVAINNRSVKKEERDGWHVIMIINRGRKWL